METLISILAGGIWNNHGVWETNGDDGPGDASGVTYDRFRIEAGVNLYKKMAPYVILLVQGGLATELRPSLASVSKKELEALGVPTDRILMEERSSTTFSQLFELKSIIKHHKPKHLWIISNEWHLPRIQAMIDCLSELKELKKLVQLFAAEEILLQASDSKWRIPIQNMRNTDEIKLRVAKEKQGVEQIQAGTYRYK